MSLDLGELVGTLRMDVTPFDQALAHGETALNSFAGTAKAAATKAGNEATAGLDTGLSGMEAEARSSASGVAAALGSELSGMEGQARSAGSGAAAALGAGLSGAEAEAAAAGSEAASSFGDNFKAGAKDVGTAAGAGLGGAMALGFVDNMSVEAGLNKVAVQLGLSQADMKVAGEVAGQVYASNFGEDLPQINEAIAGVVRNMNIEVGSADLQPITEQVLTLVDAFDQDLAMTTAAVGQMIRTGMVKDAQEGLDVLTAGLQSPANKADDLMETMNEYGTQFRNLGLDGKDAMGLLSQGLQGGARDADIVADAMKEFTLLTQGELLKVTQTADGPKHSLTALGEAFKAAGYDAMDGNKGFDMAHKLQADLAAGGPKAKKGLDVMLDSLRNTKDPLEQSRNAVSLFGTQAEDMGDALYNLDLSNASKQLGDVEGASKKAVDQMGSGAQATIDSWSRKLQGIGRDAVEALGPLGTLGGAVAGVAPMVASVVGPVVGSWLAMSGASMTGALKMAASWLIAMGPIALVIAAVVGLVIIIVKNWDTIKEKTAAAWDWVVEKTTGAWDDLVGAVKEKGGAAVDWVRSMPGKAKDALSGIGSTLKEKGKDLLQGLKDGAEDKWEAVKNWVGNVPDKATNAIGGVGRTLAEKGKDLLQGLKDGASEKWDNVVGWVQGIPERFTNNVGGVARTLAEKGKDLIQGLRDGAGEKWDAIVEWVANTGTRVSNSVGNLGTLLKDAGIAIVQGLIDGIEAKFQALKDKVGAITQWVKDHKGPKAYDLTLWRGPGNWIMEGLMHGLDDQMPALQTKVGQVTDSIANAPMPTLYASASPGAIPESAEVAGYAAQQGAGGAGITNHIYETTNPQATAAEVSRRQSLAGAGA